MVKPIVPHATDNILGAARAIARAIRLLRRRSQREDASAHSSSARRRAISRRSQLYFELPQRSSAGVGALDDHQSIAMYDRTVVPGAELGGEVAGTAAEQGGQFV
jgi:hypothetical protein